MYLVTLISHKTTFLYSLLLEPQIQKYCAIMESRFQIMMISGEGHKLHRHSEPSLSWLFCWQGISSVQY